MTGTSIDGLDAALVSIEGEGLNMRPSVKRCLSRPLGGLAGPLRCIARGAHVSAREITTIARDLALLHLETLRTLVNGNRPDLIAVHGQTVFHAPPLSWQLINPVPIAIGLGAPVVTDLRAADLASGGQGAPITPIADLVLFRSHSEALSIVNLGGFCNLTLLPRITEDSPEGIETLTGRIIGCDVCACNQILDAMSRELFNTPFDVDGGHATAGRLQVEPFKALTALLETQSNGGRSLGTGDELAAWVSPYRNRYPPEDILRTACSAIASTIVSASGQADRIILAGGGVKNQTLVKEISSRSSVPVELSDTMGVPATYREAVAMAILGALCQDRVPITLPQITGVHTPPISGIWILP